MSPSETDSLQLITAQWVLPMDGPAIEQGFVAFTAGRQAGCGKIVAVGPLAEMPDGWQASAPQPGTVLTPGLINTHVHLEQSFPAAIVKAPEEPFSAWLLRVVQKLQADTDPEAKAQRCLFGVREALSTGTTCVNDIASGPESWQALARFGLRGVVSLEVFHPGGEPVTIGHWVEKFQALQGAGNDGSLLKAGLSPHSPYNVSPAAWQALLAECRPPLVHTHVAEFEDELRYLQGRASCVPGLHQAILGRTFVPQVAEASPVAYLRRFGLLNQQTVLAHAIHTSAADREMLAQAGVSVAHCPRSNVALHGQTLRVADWRDDATAAHARIPLALGTDGRLSTDDLDLRAEARFAMAIHHWTPGEALDAMTIQGAKALGLSGQIGALSPGMAADFVLWQAPPEAVGSPEAMALSQETRVSRVVIDGCTRWPLVAQ